MRGTRRPVRQPMPLRHWERQLNATKKAMPPRCELCGQPRPNRDEDGYTACCGELVIHGDCGATYERYKEAERAWEEGR